MLYCQTQMICFNHIFLKFGILTATVSFLFMNNKNHRLHNYAYYVNFGNLKYLDKFGST